jgi:signal transduction histidine kinase
MRELRPHVTVPTVRRVVSQVPPLHGEDHAHWQPFTTAAACLGGLVWVAYVTARSLAASPTPLEGVLAFVLTPPLLSYLMLAHPTARLRSSRERRFLFWSGGTFVVLVLTAIVITGELPLRTPYVACLSHCPAARPPIDIRQARPGVLRDATLVAWLTLTLGTVALLYHRRRSAPATLRPILLPVRVWATVTAVLLIAFLVAGIVDPRAAGVIGMVYVGSGVILPLAILLGLVLERMFMGEALARLVRQFAVSPGRDPQAIIAEATGDPSLQIACRRPGSGRYVDSSGAPVTVPDDSGERGVSWLRRDGLPVAAVICDSDLCDQEPFIQAIGAAALIRLERAQLEADLAASTAELGASRLRLLESADAERRRLERDLHDGVQQQLLGLRLKLDLAAETIKSDPAAGERMLALVGRQIDDLLGNLRSLARGIYPTVLAERGLPDAIRSAARRSPVPVTVRARDIGRYPDDVEVAVYFCCLEALQNVAKHAGAGVSAAVTLSERDGSVVFEVCDRGAGFDTRTVERGSGLTNLQDRVEALGGSLTITSVVGEGTTVKGQVPAAMRNGRRRLT